MKTCRVCHKELNWLRGWFRVCGMCNEAMEFIAYERWEEERAMERHNLYDRVNMIKKKIEGGKRK